MEVEREGEAQYSKSSERRSKRTTQRHVAAKAKQIKQSLQVSAVPETRFNISNSDVPSASDCNAEVFALSNSSANEIMYPTLIPDAPIDTNLSSSLISWSHKHNITHAALDDLLRLLRLHNPNLPSSSRTLLHTPKIINIKKCDSGSYIYCGLETGIRERVSAGLRSKNYPLVDRKISEFKWDSFLSVTVNVDGLPIQSSTTNSFWPILCILDQSVNKTPFIVSLYYDDSKPDDANNFLRPFVDECLYLEKNGITIDNKKFTFRLSCIVTDAPARAFLKCIKSHNSLHACEKCIQEGTYIGRTTWEYTPNLTLRTDINFKREAYEDHQVSKSIFTELDVGLVTQVPLDYMHLVCLGVMKRIIRAWVDHGPKKCKLNAFNINKISRRLLEIKDNYYPTEFSKRPRPLKLFKYWKATEFRSFILYLGPVVLANVLPIKVYKHFLLLHCAIYILCSDFCQDSQWRTCANDLLHCFVRKISTVYCNELLVYNFHNLLHLQNDVFNFGNLDNFSAFPFENFMTRIKEMVRSHNRPLEQVAKRLGEKKFCHIAEYKPQKPGTVKNKDGTIRYISIPGNCILSAAIPNSCFNNIRGDIFNIKFIEEVPGSFFYKLHCQYYSEKTDFFIKPLKSSKIGIYKVSRPKNIYLCSSNVHKKCLLLPNFCETDTFICIPFTNMEVCH